MTGAQKQAAVQRAAGAVGEDGRASGRCYVTVSYDIPWSDGVSAAGSPVDELRRFGFHLNGSVWIFPETSMQAGVRRVTAKLEAKGADVQEIPFTPKSEADLVEMARRAIEKDAKRLYSALDAAVRETETGRVSRRVLVAQEGKSKRRATRVDEFNPGLAREHALEAVSRAKRLIAAGEEAALAFEITQELFDLFDAIRAHLTAKTELCFANLERFFPPAEAKPAPAESAPAVERAPHASPSRVARQACSAVNDLFSEAGL